jgi:hypothetical protein
MLTNWIKQQRGTAGELVVVTEGSVVLRDVLCALVRILEVAFRQFLAPPRMRSGPRLAQIGSRPGGQEVGRSAHSVSILVFEVQD